MIARDSDGAVYEWGEQPYRYQAGHAPVKKAGALEGVFVKRIFMHHDGGFFALSDDGKVYSWGNAPSNILGIGTHVGNSISDPVQIAGDISGVSIQTLFTHFSYRIFALDESGALYVWGKAESSGVNSTSYQIDQPKKIA